MSGALVWVAFVGMGLLLAGLAVAVIVIGRRAPAAPPPPAATQPAHAPERLAVAEVDRHRLGPEIAR